MEVLSPRIHAANVQSGSASHSCSSQTSASNTSTPATVASPSSAIPPFPKRFHPVSSDNYIAIGCLSFARIFQDDLHLYNGDEWTELDSLDLTFSDELAAALGQPLLRLLRASWIRIMTRADRDNASTLFKLLLVPDDVGQTYIDRASIGNRKALRELLQRLSQEGNGRAFNPFPERINGEDNSLWYIFNTISSPNPDPKRPQSSHDQVAMEQLLESSSTMFGMKTNLYPFQTRSAAFMIERETAPVRYLDPRFETRTDQDGRPYYFSPKDALFHSNPRFYETSRGGILAESMGHGKTLICLAVIVATKGHMPRVPEQYRLALPQRKGTASLMEMAASSIVRHSLPWRSMFDKYERETESEVPHWRAEVAKLRPSYEIPAQPVRYNRNPSKIQPQILTLCMGTIIVVPRPLFHQWKREISKHVGDAVLKILYMDDSKTALPSALELMEYDVVLFSRTRFELEVRDGADEQGRRHVQGPQIACTCPYIGATRIRDCTCLTPDDIYTSPLKQLHWLRIIVDEGHAFSSSNTAAVRVADQLVAERRWVVSGTPAKGLVGVDIDQTTMDMVDSFTGAEMRQLVLQDRKGFSGAKEEADGAKALGQLASKFLKVHPWTSSVFEPTARWDHYIYRCKDDSRNSSGNPSGYSACLARTLENLIVKTRPDDVEKDLVLPPLKHEIIRLDPSYYDKMTTNMFIQVMRGNAITSERADRDYLFHKDNEKPRYELIRNLRQANFAWTGFSEADIQSSIDVGTAYLEKTDAKCSEEDRVALKESMDIIKQLRDSPAWKAMSRTHELGLFIESWPKDYTETWALEATDVPAMFGMERVYHAQIHVNSQPEASALESFNAAGIKAHSTLLPDEEKKKPVTTKSKSEFAQSGVPMSFLTGDAGDASRLSSSVAKRSPIKARSKASKATKSSSSPAKRKEATVSSERQPPTPALKRLKLTFAPNTQNGPAPEPRQARFADDVSIQPVESPPESRSLGSPSSPGVEFVSSSKITPQSRGIRFADDGDDIEMNDQPATQETPPAEVSTQPLPPIAFKPATSILKRAAYPTPPAAQPPTPHTDPANLEALKQATLIGTTSAKATYLLDKFATHCPTEKILVFFDCVTTARLIQNLLDILHIPSRHFAPGMSREQQSRNKDAFQTDPKIRVLLIDVKLGGEGLDLNAASLVLIVNPICQPALEAQAIKRAHRIGQQRRVLVETLVLKGTIEEQIFERAKKMSYKEVGEGMARNEGIREVLLNVPIVPVGVEEGRAANAMARVRVPQKMFLREGYDAFVKEDDEEEGKKRRVKGKGEAKGRDKAEKENAEVGEAGQNVVAESSVSVTPSTRPAAARPPLDSVFPTPSTPLVAGPGPATSASQGLSSVQWESIFGGPG